MIEPCDFAAVLLHATGLSLLERCYIRIFGAPILGLRIRARYLLPVIRQLRTEPFKHICDAGSGRGCFTFYLARLFPNAEVIGMDLDEPQLEHNNNIAQSLRVANCRFEKQDVTKLPVEAFDFILSADTLEHLQDDHGQCRVFFQSLRTGGRILFHVPSEKRNLFGWRRMNFMGIEGHARPGYTMDGLRAMLAEAGFEIEQAFYSYGYAETLANDISYLITGGREKRKALYALAFPFLLALSQCSRLWYPKNGSGIVTLARKPAAATAGE